MAAFGRLFYCLKVKDLAFQSAWVLLAVVLKVAKRMVALVLNRSAAGLVLTRVEFSLFLLCHFAIWDKIS